MSNSTPTRRWPRRVAGALVVLLLLAIAGRIALPHLLKDYVNRTLDALPDYEGSVGDIDVSLIQGKYSVNHVDVSKVQGEQSIPFVRAERVDISVLWSALLRGEVVSEIDLVRMELNFVADSEGELEQSGEGQPWTETVQELTPIRIDRVGIVDGAISFQVPSAEEPVDLELREIRGSIVNLSNSRERNEANPAEAHLQAIAPGEAPLRLDMTLDPFASQPDFAAKLKLESLRLPELNPLIRVYLPLDVEQGELHLALSVEAREGRIAGYAKPAIDDLRLFSVEDVLGEDENPLGSLLDAAGEIASEVVEDDEADQDRIATRVELSGTVEETDVDLLEAIGGVLRNGFVEAIRPVFDDPTSLK